MEIKEFADAIHKYAPVVGTALAAVNPAALPIATLVSAIAGMFDSDENDLTTLLKKVECDPNRNAKLGTIAATHCNIGAYSE